MEGGIFRGVFTIADYAWREAIRSRALHIVIVLAVVGVAAASFLGDVSVIETNRTEVLFLASFYRFCAAFAAIVLVVSTIAREFNDKCLELFLSLPLSRLSYFSGKLLGFFLTGATMVLLYGLALLLYAEPTAVLFWSISLVCELMIVITFSLFCVLTFNQQVPASVITAFFFYLLSRASDDIILLSKSELLLHTTGSQYVQTVVEWLTTVLPRLGRFTNSEWLAYGDVPSFYTIFIQTGIYVVLISAASLFDFTRKNI